MDIATLPPVDETGATLSTGTVDPNGCKDHPVNRGRWELAAIVLWAAIVGLMLRCGSWVAKYQPGLWGEPPACLDDGRCTPAMVHHAHVMGWLDLGLGAVLGLGIVACQARATRRSDDGARPGAGRIALAAVLSCAAVALLVVSAIPLGLVMGVPGVMFGILLLAPVVANLAWWPTRHVASPRAYRIGLTLAAGVMAPVAWVARAMLGPLGPLALLIIWPAVLGALLVACCGNAGTPHGTVVAGVER